MLMACQGGFAHRCPCGASEGSLGQRGQFGYSSFTFSWCEWDPRAQRGPGVLLSLAAGCACHRPWFLCSYLYTTRSQSSLLLSLSQICLGYAIPCCHPMPGSEQVQGGCQSTWEVGWEPAWFLFSQLQKPRGTLLRSMRLRWYKPEGTKSLSLNFAI